MQTQNRFLTYVYSVLFLIVCTAVLTMSVLYTGSHYTGDTALFAEILDSIRTTGKAESNIFANTQDQIDRMVGSIPVEERLASDDSFMPPSVQSRNMLHFHFYLILYLLAPFTCLTSSLNVITIAQSFALAVTVFYLFRYLAEKQIHPAIIATACVLLTTHPGWSLPAVYGSFYPDRLFLAAFLFLAHETEKEELKPASFFLSSILCLMIGERGALFAGAFLMAYAIFFYKDSDKKTALIKFFTGVSLLVCFVLITRFALDNVYYSRGGLEMIKSFFILLSQESFRGQLKLYILINLIFILVALFDFRSFVIAVCSMVPNAIYYVGGAEKIGWTLHYHVYYFAVLIWAMVHGVSAAKRKLENKKRGNLYIFGGLVLISLVLGMINPSDTSISVKSSNLSNTYAILGPKSICNAYGKGQRQTRLEFKHFLAEHIPSDADVTSIEAGMTDLVAGNIYIYPIGIYDADYAVVGYYEEDGQIRYIGAVSYLGSEDTELLNAAVVDKMTALGYDFQDVALFPQYGIAVIHRNEVN